MKNNVLMIGYSYFFSDPRIIREAEAARDGGFEVDVICLFDTMKRTKYNSINIIAVKLDKYRGDSKLLYSLAYIRFFNVVLLLTTFLYLKKKYKVIHVNNLPDWLVFTAVIPKLFGAKIILDIHDPLSITFATKFNAEKIKMALVEVVEKLSWKFADKIITVNEIVLEEIISKGFTRRDKFSIISNYPDTNKFKYNDELAINGKLKIIYHGTIAKRFGLDDVLEAISQLKNKQNIYLKIIGTGDGSESLKVKIKEYCLESYVDFENIAYDVDSLPQIIKEYHLGIVPYKRTLSSEFLLPLKLLEYLSTGLPVITIKSKTITHYFKDDELFYYDNNDTRTLTSILDELIRHPNMVYEKRSINKNLRNKYSWQTEKNKYINLLNESC